ncbi:MAG TPA: TIGR03435 family protein [Elusimicrobiales bacterium]|nr:TIGR03435 family protein [Elusimicrobiales bacterium]
MSLKPYVFLMWLALLPAPAGAAVPEGQPAPRVSMQLLKDGAVTDFPGWAAYRGKVVVLELWGTWCAPCVVSIPHFNGLQKALQGKPVEFISVTDESAARVGKFLEQHPMAGTVAVGGGEAISAFGTGLFPQTVIISKTGTVLRYTQPEELSEKALARLLATGSAAGIRRILPDVAPAKKTARRTLFEVRIDSMSCDEPDSFETQAGPAGVTLTCSGDLRHALSQAYGIKENNIEISSALPRQSFSLTARYPQASEKMFRSLLRQAVKTAYGAEVRGVKKEKQVLLLRYDKETPHSGLQPAKDSRASVSGSNQSVRAQGARMDQIAGMLENICRLPVLDETGLAGGYDIDIEWEPATPEALGAVLKEKLGLTLVPASRGLETLEVYPAGGESGS